MEVRLYEEKDYEMLHKWCAHYGAFGPPKETISPTSFIFEQDGQPVSFISLIKTNTNWCYLENYCGNPEWKHKRDGIAKEALAFISEYAKQLGYSRLITFSPNEKLKNQYIKYGLTPVWNVTEFIKDL